MLITNLSIYFVMGLLFWWLLAIHGRGKIKLLSILIIFLWPIYIVIFIINFIRAFTTSMKK